MTPENSQEAIDVLASVFVREADADELLDRIDFPRARRPPFIENPRVFWAKVVRLVAAGRTAGGLPRLLAVASALYPHNDTLRHLDGHGNSPAEAPEPAAPAVRPESSSMKTATGTGNVLVDGGFKGDINIHIGDRAPPQPTSEPDVSKPSAPSRNERERLSQQLERLYEQREQLTIDGQDTSHAAREILDVRRLLRKGPQLRAGEFLSDGRFKLVEVLGQGGFATVWKSYDRRKQRLVAVKVLHGQYSEDRSRRERFFRGARKMAELDYPHIVRVVEEKLEDEGWHFFVMEYVGGVDFQRVVLGDTLSTEKKLRIVLEVGQALEFAHQRGMVHRDVKPSNILLDEEGRAKLADFDLVRAEDTTGLTATRAMMGTLLFAAPEALASARDVGPPADVYSLASTAVFALRGRALPPDYYRDPGPTVAGLDISEGLREILRVATSLDVAKRYRTMAEFCSALENVRAQQVNVVVPSKEIYVEPPPPANIALPDEDDWPSWTRRLGLIPGRRSSDMGFLFASARRATSGGATALQSPARRQIETENRAEDRRKARIHAARFWVVAAATMVSVIVVAVILRLHVNGNDATEPVSRTSVEATQRFDPTAAAFEVADSLEHSFHWIEAPHDGRVELWRNIPAGKFWMGSPEGEGFSDEHPRYLVEITSGFRISAVEITNALYAAFDPVKADMTKPNHPVVDVTWYEAMEFCRWLAESFDWAQGARLPTEEEWEYAARAGTETRYWSGNEKVDLARVGWYEGNADGKLHAVGEKAPNEWGLYDVHGNAWEWTLSPWTEDYSRREGHAVDPSAVVPPAADSGGNRVIRGGSFWDPPGTTRPALRYRGPPDLGGGNQGFRVVRPGRPES